jgi:membrane protein DedA with SNARE-associated domain
LLDCLGALLYGTSYSLLGFLFSKQIQQVLQVLGGLGLGALTLVLMFIPGYVALKYIQRKRVASGRIPHENAEMETTVAQVLPH